MKQLSASPDRGQFQRERYISRRVKEGNTEHSIADDLESLFDSIRRTKVEQEADPEWSVNNMEYDLRSSTVMCEKVRSNAVYAQNLYAAMCNREFQKLDVAEILKDTKWSCSWRYAGGIIADMRTEGDYIDWYCSGIREGVTPEEIQNFTPEQRERYEITRRFVGEGKVTDEIRADLLQLGWSVLPDDQDNVL